MKAITLSLALHMAGMTAIAAAAAQLPAEWEHVQELRVGRAGPVKISLPRETLGAARPGLEDLRVLDPAGQEVPFLVDRPKPEPRVVRPVKTFDVRLTPETTLISIETGLDQPIEALTLETATPRFIKAVQVEGSADGRTWRVLGQGVPVLRQAAGPAQLRIGIPAGVWRQLRLSVDDRRTEPVAFTGAQAHLVRPAPVAEQDAPVRIVARADSPGQTRLTLDFGAANLDLSELRFDTPEELFTRNIALAASQLVNNELQETVLARGVIWRVAIEGLAPAAQLAWELDARIPSREMLLLIDNQDSPPLRIDAVHAKRRPVHVVFLAGAAGDYRLFSGHPRCPAPRYDVAALRSRLAGLPPSDVTVGALRRNPGHQPPEWLPDVAGSGAPLDPTGWVWRKPVRILRPGIQQIDLDLEVLSVAQPDLRDLRVVRDEHQLPYVLERTSILQPINPQIRMADDPKSPRISRWIIQLPRRNLPVSRLSCETATPVFQRTVTLFEEVTDRRGARRQRLLGHATWSRSSAASPNLLSMALSAAPLTERLVLEVNNADNPPIALENFKCHVPLKRVLFKSTQTAEAWLYYGNPATAAPRYDLALVAAELLAAERATAELGAEQRTREVSWLEDMGAGGAGGVMFWIVLALVVVVLLFVLARLLPRAGAGG
jgi:hypothetical protein